MNKGRFPKTHGMTNSSEYKTWSSMKQRCFNKNDVGFSRYGGRGIGVASRWLKFENFIKDMGRRPTPKHSVDRIDNDKGYGPYNCRWATQQQQADNRKKNPSYPANIKELAKRVGICVDAFRYRVKSGWTGSELMKPRTKALTKKKKE